MAHLQALVYLNISLTQYLFEGERNAEYRVLRAVKIALVILMNRYFEMRETGLVDVPDASKMFLSEENSNESGTVIIPALKELDLF